jgi:hypothetical protein
MRQLPTPRDMPDTLDTALMVETEVVCMEMSLCWLLRWSHNAM